jgi:hypothetical protein
MIVVQPLKRFVSKKLVPSMSWEVIEFFRVRYTLGKALEFVRERVHRFIKVLYALLTYKFNIRLCNFIKSL